VSSFFIKSQKPKAKSSKFTTFHFQLSTFDFHLLAFSFLLTACGQSSTKDTKFQQYYVQGEQLYIKNCSNCHQKNGAGLGLVYPPINQSDYMEQHLEEVLCMIKYGKAGEILVNQKKYNMPMKGVTSLTEIEIAEIATYIYNTWNHQRGIIEVKQVDEALRKFDESESVIR
jgi:cytochrome c551